MAENILQKSKSNKPFMILSALGILFVVDCHSGNGIGFFTSVFPYDSFFMPMFMFISGYFFKEKHIATVVDLLQYIKGKFLKLLVPYLLWAVVYGLFTEISKNLNLLYWSEWNKENWLSVFNTGMTFNVNGAAWFVPALFSVMLFYSIIRKLFKPIWNDLAAFAFFIALGAVSVAVSRQRDYVTDAMLLPLKTAFFIQFYHFGVVFKRYIEKWFDSLPAWLVCLAAAAINLLLLVKYKNITFITCATMSGFITNNYFLPLITSVTGIFFWLKIAKCTEPILGNSKIVNYISDRTFFIMIHHLFFINVFSAVLYVAKKIGIGFFAEFNTNNFRHNPWYIYASARWVNTAYFLFSIIATLCACFLFDRINDAVKKLFRTILSSRKAQKSA